MQHKPEIIYEDNYLIVVKKPAGMPVMTKSLTTMDVLSFIKNKEKGGYVAVINRLDQPVEGLLVIAKDKKSASILSNSLQNKKFEKYYLAVASGIFKEKEGVLKNKLYKDGRKNMSFVSDKPGSKEAILSYEVLREKDDKTLLKIHLITGRHHQIRVQLSNINHPLIGDRKYGSLSKEKFPCLCANSLSFPHPVSKEILSFKIDPSFNVI